MKRIIKKVFVLLIKPISTLFYDKIYLKGKYFDENISGWYWVVKGIWFQKILRLSNHNDAPFPISYKVELSSYKNIIFHRDTINNFQSPGCYFQNIDAKIFICKGVYIAPNVGLITTNHDLNDLDKHQKGKNIVIGQNCWIGMNSIILPGVKLGKNTIVGAGSVVTKSFRQKNIIIVGNPAKIIRYLEKK